jgi:hypothetical protein
MLPPLLLTHILGHGAGASLPDASRSSPDDNGVTMARPVDIDTAARELGTSEAAIKKRLQRGSLPGDKDDEGRWYVLLDDRDDTTPHPQDNGAPPVTPVLEAYQDHISTLKARVTFLEGELAARTEELQRKDVLLMPLARQLPALPEQVDSGPGDLSTCRDGP